MNSTDAGQPATSRWVRRSQVVAPRICDPDLQDDAIEQHHCDHLAGLVEELGLDAAGEPQRLLGIVAEIRGSANALEAVARRRAARSDPVAV
jgi:hypothetical protein